MSKSFASSALVALLMGTVNICQAGVIPWTANINGSQEVPPTFATATGFASGTIDNVTNMLSWAITFTGLTGQPLAMHFHGPAPAGANAGVEVNIGVISGVSSPSIGSTIITTPQITDLVAGLWYINIHTPAFPPGEIRGQVVPGAVPLPATVALFVFGLAGLSWKRRKQA